MRVESKVDDQHGSVWVGTWNLGAVDPFERANEDAIFKSLESFIPGGYDLYALGVQECVADNTLRAVEVGCKRERRGREGASCAERLCH